MSKPLSLSGTAVADTYQMRRLSARAARENLDRRLDWRLDLGLDSQGMHLIVIKAILPPETYPDAGQAVRCRAFLRTVGDEEPVSVEIDLLLRDYAVLTPMAPSKSGVAKEIMIGGGDLIPDEASPVHSPRARTVTARAALHRVDALLPRVRGPQQFEMAAATASLAKALDEGNDVLDHCMMLEQWVTGEAS